MNICKIFLLSIIPLLAACDSLAKEPCFEIDTKFVLDLTRDKLAMSQSRHYADKWMLDVLAADSCALWINSKGVISSADTLLTFLKKVDQEGLSTKFFRVSELQERIDSVHSWAQNGKFNLLNDTLAAELEAGLTQAFLRYAYGQRYGYILPHELYNHLLVDGDAPAGAKRSYRQLFDINCDQPTDSFGAVAMEHVHNDNIGGFLRSVQPDNNLYRTLCKEFKKAVKDGDAKRTEKVLVNLERSRWRYQRPDTGRYVWVNLATQMLRAVDVPRDTSLEMRICIGNQGHKSPMLMSRISYMELNPYWTVPLSILRNEVAKLHVGDSSYFIHNNMTVINNNTKEEVDPVTLTASEWSSGRFTLRQGKGPGNSLGRIVFRFKNNFAVFLHDTNNPGAFNLDKRTVSHGCIRLQKPMAFAEFLLTPKNTPLYIDRVRMSIDLPPQTPEGRKLKAEDPEPLQRCDVRPTVPLWIDYYTLYPDLKGKLCEYTDIYSYDGPIAEAMKPYWMPIKAKKK